MGILGRDRLVFCLGICGFDVNGVVGVWMGISGEGFCGCFGNKEVCFCCWVCWNCVICVKFCNEVVNLGSCLGICVVCMGVWGICDDLGCVKGVCDKLGMVFFVCDFVGVGVFKNVWN